MNLLPIEENWLGILDLDLLRSKMNSESQESTMSKDNEDTLNLERSCKH